MRFSVILCIFIAAQQDSYYSQEEYYKQFPQYTQAQSNDYHGYSTPSGINSNANSVQVIEVSIPNQITGAGSFGISKSDQSIISGVIKQYLSGQSQSGPTVPYTFSVHTYNDKKSPYSSSQQTAYGSQAMVNSQSQYNQAANYQQPNYYQQQQQSSYDYSNYNYKQQQHQREVEIYEQKL